MTKRTNDNIPENMSNSFFDAGVALSKKNLRERMTETELEDYVKNKRFSLLFNDYPTTKNT